MLILLLPYSTTDFFLPQIKANADTLKHTNTSTSYILKCKGNKRFAGMFLQNKLTASSLDDLKRKF